MFAANQGQNRSRGCPLRSLSLMTLMPFASTCSGRSSEAPVASVMASPPLLIHDGLALSAVHGDVGAVDEAGPRRGEERSEERDFFRLADAAEGDGLLGEFVRAGLVDAFVAGEGALQRVPPG